MEKHVPLTKEDIIKSASILHAVEVKSSFELYAYRIISHEQYVQRIKELIQLYQKTVKSAVPERQEMDLTKLVN